MTRLEAVEDTPDGNSVEESHRLVEHATQHLLAQSPRRYFMQILLYLEAADIAERSYCAGGEGGARLLV